MSEIQTLKDEIARLTRELADRNLKVSDLLIENEARNAAIYHLNRELAAEKECVEDLRAEVERHSNAAAASRLYASQAKDALVECEEYFDDRADAEYFTDSAAPHPNEEMKLLTLVRDAIKKAGA
ncbi:hypothetical protein N182_18400 [Sinorhizobium sp. GL2]|nr:hypothetical protein N182_18400 [Sinorhizobium sp. GL2]